ncbi:MAG: hypothetical protein ACM3PY_02980 [Omnitrophica WOR_2 bacterium]
MTEIVEKNTVKGYLRIRIGLIAAVLGFLTFVLGAEPELFGLDRSPITGYLQIMVFLAGLAIICIGGYSSLSGLWNGYEKTIAADIGLRLVGTGYVIAVGSGMADLFGFGSHSYPKTPYFGPWQEAGVVIGQLVIAVGLLLLLPFGQRHKQS